MEVRVFRVPWAAFVEMSRVLGMMVVVVISMSIASSPLVIILCEGW